MTTPIDNQIQNQVITIGDITYIFGNAGDEIFIAVDGITIIYAGMGDDMAYGAAENLLFTDFSQDFTIYAGGGDDSIATGSGNDVITTDSGHDLVFAGAGDDRLNGGDGNNLLNGGDGDDSLYGRAGLDILDGGTGRDVMTGGADSDIFLLREPVSQTEMADIITDFSADDYLTFYSGAVDEIWYKQGVDTGKGANDTILYADSDATLIYAVLSDYHDDIEAADFLPGSVGVITEIQ